MRTFLVRKSEVGTGTRAVRSKMATFIRLQDSAGQNLENCVLILVRAVRSMNIGWNGMTCLGHPQH